MAACPFMFVVILFCAAKASVGPSNSEAGLGRFDDVTKLLKSG
jgi:hypothetical protein